MEAIFMYTTAICMFIFFYMTDVTQITGNNTMASYCLFCVLYAVGTSGLYYGQPSEPEPEPEPGCDPPAPIQTSLALCFFTLIKYPLPFILCTTIWCSLKRPDLMVSLLRALLQALFGFFSSIGGATTVSINSLPIYIFKVNMLSASENNNDIENNYYLSGADAEVAEDEDDDDGGNGGIIILSQAKSREEEGREVCGEDAVCSICLVKYANNDKLKELPCSHLFHKECIDKWLKINASCPLCKAHV